MTNVGALVVITIFKPENVYLSEIVFLNAYLLLRSIVMSIKYATYHPYLWKEINIKYIRSSKI